MSEELPPPTPKTAAIPPPKISAVPLKKETVRITLRARPSAGSTQPRETTSPVPTVSTGSIPPPTDKRSTAPIQLPSAPLPPPSPKSLTNPVSLPPAPIPPPGRNAMPVAPSAPSAPPASTGGAPRPPVAAPRPMAPGGAPASPRPMAPTAPRVETGAATQPLAGRPPMAAPRPPGGGTGTAPLAGGAPGGGLPKATQKLQATQPMGRPTIKPAPPSAPVKRSAAADSQQFYEEKDPEAGLVPLSMICLVLSLILMAVQVLATDRLFSAAPGEESSWMVPQYESVPWETRDAEDGSVISKFSTVLPELPQ